MIISMKCENCLGEMQVDDSHEVLVCPFCQSHKMIPMSDEVRITKLNNEHDLKLRELEYAEEERKRKDKNRFLAIYFSVLIGLIIFFMFFLRGIS